MHVHWVRHTGLSSLTSMRLAAVCAAVLLLAVSVIAFPEADETELKIIVEVSSRLTACQTLQPQRLRRCAHLPSVLTWHPSCSPAAQAQGLCADGKGW